MSADINGDEPSPRSPDQDLRHDDNGDHANKRTASQAGLSDDGHDHKLSRHSWSADLDPMVTSKLDSLASSGVVRPDELDDRTMRDLSEFEPSVAVEILEQFGRSDMNNVRNKSGFLGGVMTRFRRQPGPKLPMEVQQRLDQLFRSKKLKASDLDPRAYENLHAAPPEVAAAALDRFTSKDLASIRNHSAFLIAQIRAASEAMGGGRGRPGGPPHRDDVGGRFRDLPPAPHGGAYGVSPRGVPPPVSHHAPLQSAPPPMMSAYRGGSGGRINHGQDQALVGVRVSEFHNLADSAPYVPAAVALKLQTLWDSGVKLVSMLDDRSWDLLAELPAPEGLAVVDEVAAAMERPPGLRNINAYFMSVGGKMVPKRSSSSYDRTRGPSSYNDRPPPASLDRGSLPSYTSGAVGGYSGAATGSGRHGASSSRPAAGYGGSAGRPDRGPPRGGGPTPAMMGSRGVCAMHLLSSDLRRHAESVIAKSRGYLNPDHFDEGVASALNRLGDRLAFQALDEVLGQDLSTVRSVPAYIMSICKRLPSRSRY